MGDPAANEALVRRLVDELVNGGRLELFDEVLSEDFVAHGVGPGLPPGPDGMRALVRTWRRAFPDWQDTIHELVANDELVSFRITARGTHTGRLLDIEPTGEPVEWEMLEMVRVRDGRICEQWGHSNFHEVVARLRRAAAVSH
ncbi:MAG: ester cyclase [Acidimicrobiales bacterium]|nr:ester cyclase [Acidimicrobiales bacterium]